MSDDPTLDVAKDLREIVQLHQALEAQAVAKADDHEMPGGDAMAMLAPVSSPEARDNRIDGLTRWNAEHYGDPEEQRDLSHVDDELDWEPPLQSLLFWSEAWRYEHGAVSDFRPTIESEARWLAGILRWAWDNEPHHEDFARDVRGARMRLENLLRAGERTAYGVPCPKCREAALVRTTHERRRYRDCEGHGPNPTCTVPRNGCCDRGGLDEKWTCPKCGKVYPDLASYSEAVTRDYINHAPALPIQHIERRTTVKPGTVKMWVTRGHVRTKRDGLGRVVYLVADIERRLSERDDAA